MTAKVLPVPEKLQKAIGEEATRELVDLINQMAAVVSSAKVDKTEYDAHAALIEEKFARYKAETESMIRAALLKGLAWMTALIIGQFGALWLLMTTLK